MAPTSGSCSVAGAARAEFVERLRPFPSDHPMAVGFLAEADRFFHPPGIGPCSCPRSSNHTGSRREYKGGCGKETLIVRGVDAREKGLRIASGNEGGLRGINPRCGRPRPGKGSGDREVACRLEPPWFPNRGGFFDWPSVRSRNAWSRATSRVSDIRPRTGNGWAASFRRVMNGGRSQTPAIETKSRWALKKDAGGSGWPPASDGFDSVPVGDQPAGRLRPPELDGPFR